VLSFIGTPTCLSPGLPAGCDCYDIVIFLSDFLQLNLTALFIVCQALSLHGNTWVFEILNPDFAFKKRKNLIPSKPSSRSLCFNANFPGPSRLRDEGFEGTYVKQFHDHYEYYA
jgi:hypothetical protein